MKKKNKISAECRQRLEALGMGFKVARRSRFLTIRQVSEISGVSVATLCRLERSCPNVSYEV